MKAIQSVLSLTLILGLGATAAVAKDAPKGAQTMDRAAMEKSVRHFYAMVSAGKINSMDGLMTKNFIDHNPEPGQKGDWPTVRKGFQEMGKAFSKIKFDPMDIVIEGDKVAIRVQMSGTQKAAFMGMPSKGKSFSIQGFDLIKFTNGKVSDRWGTFDSMAMMTQLGMMPAPKPGK